MKISYKGDYSLKTILELSLNYNSKKIVQIKSMAKKLNIPVKYLEQLLLILKGAGYVRSIRGPSGGYFLARHPKEITVGEIIRKVEGDTAPIACVGSSSYNRCEDTVHCVFRQIWVDVKNSINNIVDNITFEDLVKRVREKETKNFVYNI